MTLGARRRQAQPGVRARAGGAVADARLAPVGGGDQVDDRRARGRCRLRSGRCARLKRSKACGRNAAGKPGAFVEHVKLTTPSCALIRSVIGPDAVAQGVVDQVRERLLDARHVGGDSGSAARLDRELPAALARADPEAAWRRLRAGRGRPRVGVEIDSPGVAARHEQKVLGQLSQAVGLLAGDPKGRAQRLGRVVGTQGHLDLGLEDRKRSAQLVAGVRDEGPLAVARPLQPLEQSG